LSFCIQFFRQHVNIAFQHALASVIKRKITLVGDVCSKHPITIKSHDLHASDIRKVVDEIIFYQERDQLSPFFLVPASYSSFGLFLTFPFCLSYDGFGH